MLGKLEFEGRPLRELLLDAIRYGEQPEVRARLDTAVDQALDRATLQRRRREVERGVGRDAAATRRPVFAVGPQRRQGRRGAFALLVNELHSAQKRPGELAAACGESRGSGLAGRGRMPYIL